MDRIDWGAVGEAFETHTDAIEFSKHVLQPQIAIAELKAEGKLPS